MEDLLQSAILKVKQRVVPGFNQGFPIVPEPHTQLYPILQIDNPDEETVDRVKFIYNYFLENGGNPKDQAIDVYTTRMSAISDVPLVDRIYKYCKLLNAANRAKRYYETLEKEINAFGGNR